MLLTAIKPLGHAQDNARLLPATLAQALMPALVAREKPSVMITPKELSGVEAEKEVQPRLCTKLGPSTNRDI